MATVFDYTIGGFSYQGFDIEASVAYLYIAVLSAGGTPQVLKMAATIDADATVEYDPAAGTFINVSCGEYSQDLVWAAGDFGTNEGVVLNDYIKGVYWTQYGYWYNARPFVVGPGNDALVMVVETNDNLVYESYFWADNGPYWTNVGEVDYDASALARWDVDPFRALIGYGPSDAEYWYPSYFYPYVEYSPSGGAAWFDVSGLLANEDSAVTSVIFG